MNIRATLLLAIAIMVIPPISGCARDEPGALIARADQQIAEGDYRTASIGLRNAIQQSAEDSPEHREARALLGRASLALGDPVGAEQQLNRARELGASPDQYALPLAQALLALGRAADAYATLEQLPEAARGTDWAVTRAEVVAAQGRLAEARGLLDEVLRDSPVHYRALTLLARIQAATDELPEARELIDRAIAADEQPSEALVFRARLHLQAGRVTDALADLERAVEIESRRQVTPRTVEAYQLLVQVQLSLNRTEDLARTRDQLRRRVPDLPLTSFVEGAVHYLDQEYREAILKLQESLTGAPDNEQALLLLGASYLATDNLGQAEQALRRVVVGLQSRNPVAARLLAETRRRQGRPDLALSLLRDIPGGDQDPQILALKGVISIEAGLPGEAVAFLEQAAAAAPGQPAIQLQLARAYLAADRRSDALAMLDGPFGADAESAVLQAIDLLGAQGIDGDPAAARARAEQLAAEDGQGAMAAALFHQATGDVEAARTAIQRAVEIEPRFVSGWLTRGAIELGAGDREAALTSFREATELDPGAFRGWLGLAQLAALDGVDDEALRFTRRAVDAAPEQVQPLLSLAQLELRAGNMAEVGSIASRARGLAPENPDVITLLGLVAVQEQRFDEAISQFQRAAQAQPQRADRWQNLAQAQLASGQLEAARDALQRAVQAGPQVLGTRFSLAQVQAQLGDLRAALDTGRQMQRDFPAQAQGYLVEANILAAQEDFAGAALKFEQAYERNANFETAAAIHQARRRGEMPGADGPLRRWLAANPDDLRGLILLGEYLSTSDEAAAAAQFERVVQIDPGNIIGLNNAAWLLRESDRTRAEQYARRALELAPDEAPILDTLGWILVLDGRAEEGLPHLRRASSRAPQAGDIRYHLAVALAETGARAEARDLLQGLLSGDAPFSYRDEAEALLAGL